MLLGDSMKPKSLLAYSFLTIGFLSGCVAFCDIREEEDGWPLPDLSPLSAERRAHYEKLARQWLSRVWTNDHAAYRAYVHLDKNDTSGTPYDRPPWQAPVVECYFRDERPEASNRLYSVVRFINRDSDAVRSIDNSIYRDIPYNKHAPGIPKPNHVSERQARERASEISAMFGVSNIWDETRFDTRCAGLIQGHWEFYLSHRINGYPTTHPLTIIIADLPGAPLYRWTSAIGWEGTDIPTNVVLTPEQARVNGEGYLKKYFPLRDMVHELTH